MNKRVNGKGRGAMVRSLAVLGGIVATLASISVAVAGPLHNGPHPSPTVCVPNQPAFGYFPTTWRQWPCEARPAQDNPRSIGAEVIPTPPAQETVPLPKATPQLQPQPPRPQSESPFQLPPLNEPQQQILPPEQEAIPRSILPELPAEPKAPLVPSPSTPSPSTPSPSTHSPSFEGVLPGLPLEPNPSAIPNPFDSVPKDQEAKPSEPSKPAEQPKDAEMPKPPSDVAPAEQPKGSETPKPPSDAKPAVKPDARTDAKPAAKALRVSTPANTTTSETHRPLRVQREATIALMSGETVEETGGEGPVHHAEAIAVLPAKLEGELQNPDAREAGPFFGRHVKAMADTSAPKNGPDPGLCSSPAKLAERVEPAAYATVESSGHPDAKTEASEVTLALDGYCPVELLQSGHWVPGDLRWTVVHGGRIYRLSGEGQRRQFLADPEAFSPVLSGNDPVLMVEEHRPVAGRVAYCATYNNRLYMFSNPATQARFNESPQRYVPSK